MGCMEEVSVQPVDLVRLAEILPADRAERLVAAAGKAQSAFGDRVVWHVNATSRGGGVAEMLQTLLAYGKGAGIANRWLVLDGDPHFFAITKRLHNVLHGEPGDGGPLGPAEHRHYQQVLRANLADLTGRVSSRDIVLLHDPQTAGLAEGLRTLGATVVWRCHVGRDEANHVTEAGWAFLRPYLAHAQALVFSRRAYAPDWVDPDLLTVIPALHRPARGQEHDAGTRARHRGAGRRRVGLGRPPGEARRLRPQGRHRRDGAVTSQGRRAAAGQ